MKAHSPNIKTVSTTEKNLNKEWLTIDECAEHFRARPKTVRKWLYERKLRYYKVGGLVRIHVSDVKAFPVCIPTANEIMDKL